MRQKRAKTYKRLMALYVQTFNFRQPFQVLVSDDLLTMPAAGQVDIVKLLSTCVQAEIKPMITQCCVEALYALGRSAQRTTDLAKSFERRRCNHRTALPSAECLTDMIGTSNKHRYVLAAQSQQLRDKLDTVPGLPMVHFNGRGVLVLSPPSTATVREKNKAEEERRMGEKKGMEGLEEGDNVIGRSSASAAAGGEGKARARGTKAPNPLSVKKKKKPAAAAATAATAPATTVQHAATGKKRSRDNDGDEREPQHSKQADGGGQAGENADPARKKKKRKRRGKGDVALAIQELNASALAGEEGAAQAAQESGGEDSE